MTQEEKDERKRKELEEFEKYKADKQHKLDNPNFIMLTWKALVAFKEKNCPVITWDRNEEIID